jgi:hypothetical protein
MSWFRIPINIGLAVLLLIDVRLGVQAYTQGWPARVTLSEVRPGVEAVKVSRLPFTKVDVWILIALVGTNILLVWLAWRFNKRGAARQ